jgi:Sigma-70, region 4
MIGGQLTRGRASTWCARCALACGQARLCCPAFYLDLSEADTAPALGVSVGTVKSQTAKALRRLRRLLAEPGAVPARGPEHGQGGA